MFLTLYVFMEACSSCCFFFLKDEEIKMEDADKEEERVINIDACDEKNPLAVVEYIDDMHRFYKESEVT